MSTIRRPAGAVLALTTIFGFFNVSATAIAAPQISRPITDSKFQPVVRAIEAQMKAQDVPGLAVAIVQNGKVTFQRGFGVRNTETKDPVTPTTLFRIGSTTKPLTVIGVMQLVEAGKVKLDEPVANYVPEFKVNSKITVRHILSHSSGLADGGNPYGRIDAAALKDYVTSLTSKSAFAPPGTVLSYSNPAFSVAGRLIERVSGMNYATYMDKNVFPALGMSRTTLLPNIALTYPLAVGYQPGNAGLETVRPNPDNVVEYPAGFVFSSVEDLSRLALFLLQDGKLNGKTILSTSSMQAMKTPVLDLASLNVSYGLGLIVEPKNNNITNIGHDGSINGYSAALQTIPSKKFGVVILANKIGFNSTPILEAATQSLLQTPKPNPTLPIKLKEAALKAYTGNYAVPGITGRLGNLSVVVEQGKLKSKFAGQPDLELRSLRPDTFQVFLGNTQLGDATFLRDKTGKITFLNYGLRAYPRLNDR
ncbi:serine hydrolase [Leptolyngbya sp. FACHB-17]|uniref:serine hydrolase n=1 Tax=unclassified Leptolyngbya TaxID=2650499 RepID=UPI001680B107|nr:serine hydrolase [Leptolyngbya sp. FACHB-17]MBD2078495.1 serine hydrolase [Leptolyngbya sp. FACHB-17]